MRKVLIVGAGQSGLQLGLSLLDHGYEVTVVSARTPEEIRAGRIMSTQCMFGTALRQERDRGLDLWQDEAPDITGMRVAVAGPDGTRALDWLGRLDHPAQSVDQRMKMATWLEMLADRGGEVVRRKLGPSDVDDLARDHELVVIATGAGGLSEMFEHDPGKSPYREPQRMLAVSYVHGATTDPADARSIRFNAIPGLGELFVIPGYTFSGPCEMPFFEAVPGGPFDRWSDRPEPAEQWSRMLDLMCEYVPWEYERLSGAELTDGWAALSGRVTPTVREPVAHLPSGRPALGMADAVVTNDPITGQGANSASKCAASYLDDILLRGADGFDEDWMRATFERFWDDARHVTAWTNAMLQPLPTHVVRLLGAAAENAAIRDRFANGFDNPADFETWFLDSEGADEYLRSFAA